MSLLRQIQYGIEKWAKRRGISSWTIEAKRRRDQARDAVVQPIPGEEALAQVRRFLEQ